MRAEMFNGSKVLGDLVFVPKPLACSMSCMWKQLVTFKLNYFKLPTRLQLAAFLTGFHSLSKSLVTRLLERQPDRPPRFFSPRKTQRNSEPLRTGCPNSSPPHQGWPRFRAGTRKPDVPNRSLFEEPLRLATGH